jgi:DnaJ-class molecular chaperone
MRDPYTVLGVTPATTQDEIKKAYRKLAQELHPDRRPDDAAAESRFKEVSAAYGLLSDKQKRARFDNGEVDANGTDTRRNHYPHWSRSSAGTEHPFERFFRHRGGGSPRPGAEVNVKGADVAYTIEVDFLEAAKGTVKRIDLIGSKRLDIKVPPGTSDGQVLRLKNQGMPGTGGGATGSAQIEIKVRTHPEWRLDGSNLHANVPVTLPEAVLGGRIEVETIDGTMAVTVPMNANSGTILRLRGKGMTKENGTRGNHFVHLAVTLPDKPDKRLTSFVRKWSEKNNYEVRSKRAKED